ncbi:MAG: peptidase S8, partial [Hyphomicrobiaceae bacterium]
DPALEAMIDASQKRNAVIVAAAGNGGPKAPPAYPAAYPDVVAVTAVDATVRRYVHANRGKYIAISASGVDILAPADGGKHTFLSGTSFAAAHISGIAALLLERNSDAGARGVLAALTENAVDLGPAGWDEDFGFGRADAFAALQAITKDK